jgi:hypothetical protein
VRAFGVSYFQLNNYTAARNILASVKIDIKLDLCLSERAEQNSKSSEKQHCEIVMPHSYSMPGSDGFEV